MQPHTDTFADRAAKFSRNPLGIIALFIVLVYGIAGLVFGLSGAKLDADQRWPLIWFLVIFPVLVLGLFGWLVSQHHTKLYAPGDFADKDGFFRALSTSEQRERLDQEVEEAARNDLPDDAPAPVLAQETVAGVQETIRSKYILAEDLMFRELQSEFKAPISRQVGVSGRDVGFDGVASVGDMTYVIETKFTRSSLLLRRAREYAENLSRLRNSLPPNVKSKFILSIAFEGALGFDRNEILNRISSRINQLGIDAEVRLYDFNELKDKYGINK